jgi:hypothetical protein
MLKYSLKKYLEMFGTSDCISINCNDVQNLQCLSIATKQIKVKFVSTIW